MRAGMIQPGEQVTWIRRKRDGSIGHSQFTRVLTLESIVTTDGNLVPCAVLSCNRFVPVSELYSERLGVSPPCESSENTSSTMPTVVPLPAKVETVKTPASRKRTSAAAESGKAAADASQTVSGSSAAVRCSILIIDFMNLLVRAWHVGKPTETHAVRSMFQTVANAVRNTRPQTVVFAMEGGYTHRQKLLPTYKAHRPPSDPNLISQRALAEQAIRAAGMQLIRVEGFEADDVIASIVRKNAETVICSSDKDLLSLCGRCRIYHPWGAGKFVTAEDVLGVSAGQVTDYLALTGDTSDGIPGVKGIGPKSASELLEKHTNLEGVIVASKYLRIPGATGRNVASGIQQALLSEQLVKLVDNLNLPPINSWEPITGWQQRLTELNLGSVTTTLESAHAQLDAKTTPAREGLSATTEKVEQPEDNETGNSERPVSAERIVHPLQDKDRSVQAHSAEQCSPNAAADSESDLVRPLTDTVPVSLTDNQRWYAAGQQCRRQDICSHERTENPWRTDSTQHAMWQAGYDGRPIQDAVQLIPQRPKKIPAAARTAGLLFQ